MSVCTRMLAQVRRLGYAAQGLLMSCSWGPGDYGGHRGWGGSWHPPNADVHTQPPGDRDADVSFGLIPIHARQGSAFRRR